MVEKVSLKPKIRSELVKIKETPDFDIYQFTPSLFKAFPFRLEKISIAYRLRCALEYFVGYKVFYIKQNGVWGVLHSVKWTQYPLLVLFFRRHNIRKVFCCSEFKGAGTRNKNDL